MTCGIDSLLDVVLFETGGYRFALEAAAVAGLRPFDREADVRVPSIESRLGVAAPITGARLVLRLRSGTACTVPTGATLAALPVSAIHPLPSLIEARLTVPAVKALAVDGRGVVILADLC